MKFFNISILVAGLMASTSISAEPSLLKTQLQNAEGVVAVESCFANTRKSYEGFIAHSVNEIKQNGGRAMSKMNSELLSKRFKPKFFARAKKNLACYLIQYNVDGVLVDGYAVAQKNVSSAQSLVIHNRGGNGDFGRTPIISMFSHLPLIKQGAIVMGSQYRKADEFGGADIQDVHALIDIGKSMALTKNEKVKMVGVSRGAMTSYMVARTRKDISKLVINAGLSDLAYGLTIRPEMERIYQTRIPNYETQKETALKERSAINWVHELDKNIEILLVHGDNDKRVNVGHARNMAKKLKELNHPHKLVIYPGGDHSLRAEKRQVAKEINNWLF